MPSCLTLSIIRYVSRVKWSNPGKGVAPSPTPRCSSYWKGSLLFTLDYSHQQLFIEVVKFSLHFEFLLIMIFFQLCMTVCNSWVEIEFFNLLQTLCASEVNKCFIPELQGVVSVSGFLCIWTFYIFIFWLCYIWTGLLILKARYLMRWHPHMNCFIWVHVETNASCCKL